MANSMTGFGRGEATRARTKATVELRSVNQRFLNVSVRMPGWLNSLEPSIRDRVGKRLRRGQIDVNIDLEGEEARPQFVVDTAAAISFLEEWRRIQRELDLDGDITIEVMAANAELLTTSRPKGAPEEVWPVVEEALSSALDALEKVRSAEGKETAADILARLDAVEKSVKVIEERVPEAVSKSVERMRERIADLLGERRAELSDEDLARETAIIADKSDVAEEVARLGMHIGQVRELLSSGGEAGRRLEFLTQELTREINTIGSKSSDSAIAAEVVNVKVEIERVREQARNVE